MANNVKYTSYSQFISNIDPCKEEEACLLRSGLIYPQNPAIIARPEWDRMRFRCYHCGAWYDSRDSLRKHLKFRHLKEFRTIDDHNTPRWHCTKCRKEFGCKPSTDKIVTHFCNDSEFKKDKLTEANDLKMCAVGGPRSALKIKRVRFECRVHTELINIEQWLKYELVRDPLTRTDYLEAAKMFIAVKGYKVAIGLLQKSLESLKVNKEDDGAEQTLIDVASEMMKKSKR